ncbi:HD domain-containing protein, partial [bacterium]
YIQRGQDLATKARGIRRFLSEGDVMREVTETRCTRGAEIARLLGFSSLVSDAVRDIDEHWDGRGAPRGLKGEETGIVARVLGVAQTLEVFVTDCGIVEAYRMLGRRRGRWFDPAIVAACGSFRDDAEFWGAHAARAEALTLEIPVAAAAQTVVDSEIDDICEAFAQIVDAKSSFTAEHSTRVTAYAVELGRAFGFETERLRMLRRAALLHDVGKLGVSNGILEKPGKPTDEEFAAIRLHPRFTWDILSPIRGFSRLADLAAAHHERLDGRGYWRGWDAERLDLDMRILAVADVFDALSADRPYRGAMTMTEVFGILDRESGVALDASCIEILRERYGDRSEPLRLAA